MSHSPSPSPRPPPVSPGPAGASHPATRLNAFTAVAPLPPPALTQPGDGCRWALPLSLPARQVLCGERLPPSCPLPSLLMGPQPCFSSRPQALPTWVSCRPGPPNPSSLMAFQTRAFLPRKVPSCLRALTRTRTHSHTTETHRHTLTLAHTHPHTHTHSHNPPVYILSHIRPGAHTGTEAQRGLPATQVQQA